MASQGLIQDHRNHGYQHPGACAQLLQAAQVENVNPTWIHERPASRSGNNKMPFAPEIYGQHASQPSSPKVKLSDNPELDSGLIMERIYQATDTPLLELRPEDIKMGYFKPGWKSLEQYSEIASLGDPPPEPRVLAVVSTTEDKPSLPEEPSALSCPQSRQRDSVTSNEYPARVMLPPPPPPPGPGPGPRPRPNITFRDPSPSPSHTTVSTSQDNFPSNREWEKIKRLRVEVWGLRSQMHERRRILKEKQQIVAAADNAYFSHVRRAEAGLLSESKNPSAELQLRAQLFQACSIARDEYGPLEDDLTLLETNLGTQEFALQRIEEDFYSRSPPPPPPPSFPASGPSRPSSPSSASSFIDKSSHPLLTEYLSLLGDISILEERLDWIIEEKESLEAEALTRARVNLTLAPPDLAWLHNFPATEDAFIKELEEIEKKRQEVQKQCFELGLVNEEGEPTGPEERERRIFSNETSVEAGSEKSGFVKFPVLIPQPGLDPPSISGSDIAGITGKRIDQWLLSQLRSSPLAVNLLARTFESMSGKIKQDKWEIDVLNYWYKDSKDEGEDNAKRRAPSSGVVTQAPRNAGAVTRSKSDVREGQEGEVKIHPASEKGLMELRWVETREGYQYLLPFPQNPRPASTGF